MTELDVTTRLLEHFAYKHLPENLQVISKPFGTLALKIARMGKKGELNLIDVNMALVSLLQAKDNAVRGALVKGALGMERADT